MSNETWRDRVTLRKVSVESIDLDRRCALCNGVLAGHIVENPRSPSHHALCLPCAYDVADALETYKRVRAAQDAHKDKESGEPDEADPSL